MSSTDLVSLHLSASQYRLVLAALKSVPNDDPALADAVGAMRRPRMAASDAQDISELLATQLQAGIDLIRQGPAADALAEWAADANEVLEAYFEVPGPSDSVSVDLSPSPM